jgi:puromycin-sensitive aminopeptidase
LITVIERQSTANTRIVQLKQQRFIADGSADDEYLQWKIPITLLTKANPQCIAHQLLMDTSDVTLTLNDVTENDWIKLNYKSIGLYRVQYESNALTRLSESIVNKSISPQDRLMIQDDLNALCKAGRQSFVDYLQLLFSYKDEDNFTVWKSIGTSKSTGVVVLPLLLFFVF